MLRKQSAVLSVLNLPYDCLYEIIQYLAVTADESLMVLPATSRLLANVSAEWRDRQLPQLETLWSQYGQLNDPPLAPFFLRSFYHTVLFYKMMTCVAEDTESPVLRPLLTTDLRGISRSLRHFRSVYSDQNEHVLKWDRVQLLQFQLSLFCQSKDVADHTFSTFILYLKVKQPIYTPDDRTVIQSLYLYLDQKSSQMNRKKMINFLDFYLKRKMPPVLRDHMKQRLQRLLKAFSDEIESLS